MRENGFSELTKSELARIAQYRCVRPGCNRPTHFYDRAQDKYVHMGAAAHDAPAGNFGLRAENDLTSEQIKAYINGAWLCRNCATLVDIVQQRFPLGTLPRWQHEAENAHRNSAISPVQASHINYSEAIERAHAFLDLTKRISFLGWNLDWQVPQETKAQIDIVSAKCLPLIPRNSYSSLFPHTVNVQMRMLDALLFIKSEVTDFSAWYVNFGYYIPQPVSFVSHEQRLAIQASSARVDKLIKDYFLARQYLESFTLGRIEHHLLYLW